MPTRENRIAQERERRLRRAADVKRNSNAGRKSRQPIPLSEIPVITDAEVRQAMLEAGITPDETAQS